MAFAFFVSLRVVAMGCIVIVVVTYEVLPLPVLCALVLSAPGVWNSLVMESEVRTGVIWWLCHVTNVLGHHVSGVLGVWRGNSFSELYSQGQCLSCTGGYLPVSCDTSWYLGWGMTCSVPATGKKCCFVLSVSLYTIFCFEFIHNLLLLQGTFSLTLSPGPLTA